MANKIKLSSINSRLRPMPGDSLANAGSWRSDKATANARGYDYQWQRYRLDYLANHPICMMRGNGCTLASAVVDHVIPHRGNASLFRDPANHQALCAHCHNVHKANAERSAC